MDAVAQHPGIAPDLLLDATAAVEAPAVEAGALLLSCEWCAAGKAASSSCFGRQEAQKETER